MPGDPHDFHLLELVLRELELSGISEVSDAAIEDGADSVFEGGARVMTFARRLAITTEIREAKVDGVHAHVISWFVRTATPGGKDELDACLLGFGDTTDACLKQVAHLWLRLVGAPILSGLTARPLMDAAHFEGSEVWGIPGGHGFVGPFMVRGPGCDDVDLDALSESGAFLCDDLPRDAVPHLAKVTLLCQDGVWERTIEIDGHSNSNSYVDRDWRGVAAPSENVLCTRFALFVKGH